MRPLRTLSLTLLAGGCFSPARAEPIGADESSSSSGEAGSLGSEGTAPESSSADPSVGDDSSGVDTIAEDGSSDDNGSGEGSESTGEPAAVCGDGVAAPGELCFDDITLVEGYDVVYSARLLDVDTDGANDLVYLIGDQIEVHLGTGDGVFGPALGGDTVFPSNAEVGDVDGDGFTDIAVINDYYDTLEIVLGDGAGELALQMPPLLGVTAPHELVLIDLDGTDGDEIIVAHDEGVQVYRSNGDGTPESGYGFGSNGPVRALGLGEFDGDGDVDLVYVFEAYEEQWLTIRLGNGDATFGSQIMVDDAGELPRGVAGADMNGDGDGDLLYVDSAAALLYVHLGNGAGGFAEPIGVETDADPRRTLVLDVTGDGLLDVVVGHQLGQSLWIFAGDGTGHLAAPLQIPLAGPVDSLAHGFANDDAIPDLVATDGGAQRVSILLSTP